MSKNKKKHSNGTSSWSNLTDNGGVMSNMSAVARKILTGANKDRPIFRKNHTTHTARIAHA
jgi:hypothetical protein